MAAGAMLALGRTQRSQQLPTQRFRHEPPGCRLIEDPDDERVTHHRGQSQQQSDIGSVRDRLEGHIESVADGDSTRDRPVRHNLVERAERAQCLLGTTGPSKGSDDAARVLAHARSDTRPAERTPTRHADDEDSVVAARAARRRAGGDHDDARFVRQGAGLRLDEVSTRVALELWVARGDDRDLAHRGSLSCEGGSRVVPLI